jgi:hypothetical protein
MENENGIGGDVTVQNATSKFESDVSPLTRELIDEGMNEGRV